MTMFAGPSLSAPTAPLCPLSLVGPICIRQRPPKETSHGLRGLCITVYTCPRGLDKSLAPAGCWHPSSAIRCAYSLRWTRIAPRKRTGRPCALIVAARQWAASVSPTLLRCNPIVWDRHFTMDPAATCNTLPRRPGHGACCTIHRYSRWPHRVHVHARIASIRKCLCLIIQNYSTPASGSQQSPHDPFCRRNFPRSTKALVPSPSARGHR